jgi:hypothetical protein
VVRFMPRPLKSQGKSPRCALDRRLGGSWKYLVVMLNYSSVYTAYMILYGSRTISVQEVIGISTSCMRLIVIFLSFFRQILG